MRENKTVRDCGRGVSPVIGVILMVAITVVLAAVIGQFVLQLGGSVEEGARAGVMVDYDSLNDRVVVNWVSEGNSEYVNVTVSQGGSVAECRLDRVGSQIVVDTGGTTVSSGVSCSEKGSVSQGDLVDVVAVAHSGGSSSTVLQKSGDI